MLFLLNVQVLAGVVNVISGLLGPRALGLVDQTALGLLGRLVLEFFWPNGT